MNKNLVDIFKYFGNKDFANANAGKEFTIDEMLSIMMHSQEVAVEDRVADLRVLAEHVDAETKSKIERCIKVELKKLDIIKHIKEDDTRFVSYYNDIAGQHRAEYATFDELMASGVDRDTVFVNTYNEAEHRSTSIADFYVKDGKVTHTFVVSEFDNDADTKELKKREVSLNCPFRPFDFIVVAGKRYIVAKMDGNIDVHEHDCEGWINITIPVYVVHDDGTISIDIVHKSPWRISQIYKVNPKNISLSDIEELEYIKEHLE